MKSKLPKIFCNILLIILVGQALYTVNIAIALLDANCLTVGSITNRAYASELISTNVLRTVLYGYIFLKVKSCCSNHK